MFVKLSSKAQIQILAMKINEVEMSDQYSLNDKKIIKKICRQKLKNIQPNNKKTSIKPKNKLCQTKI